MQRADQQKGIRAATRVGLLPISFNHFDLRDCRTSSSLVTSQQPLDPSPLPQQVSSPVLSRPRPPLTDSLENSFHSRTHVSHSDPPNLRLTRSRRPRMAQDFSRTSPSLCLLVLLLTLLSPPTDLRLRRLVVSQASRAVVGTSSCDQRGPCDAKEWLPSAPSSRV